MLLIHHVSGSEGFPDTALLIAETQRYHIEINPFLWNCLSFLPFYLIPSEHKAKLTNKSVEKT